MTRGRCGSLFHFRMTFAFTTPRRFGRRTRRQPMKLRKISYLKYFAAIAGALLVLAAPALAGPPLICHSIDIETAPSLPCTRSGWNLTGNETYAVNHLVTDTLSLLTANRP